MRPVCSLEDTSEVYFYCQHFPFDYVIFHPQPHPVPIIYGLTQARHSFLQHAILSLIKNSRYYFFTRRGILPNTVKKENKITSHLPPPPSKNSESSPLRRYRILLNRRVRGLGTPHHALVRKSPPALGDDAGPFDANNAGRTSRGRRRRQQQTTRARRCSWRLRGWRGAVAESVTLQGGPAGL